MVRVFRPALPAFQFSPVSLFFSPFLNPFSPPFALARGLQESVSCRVVYPPFLRSCRPRRDLPDFSPLIKGSLQETSWKRPVPRHRLKWDQLLLSLFFTPIPFFFLFVSLIPFPLFFLAVSSSISFLHLMTVLSFMFVRPFGFGGRILDRWASL